MNCFINTFLLELTTDVQVYESGPNIYIRNAKFHHVKGHNNFCIEGFVVWKKAIHANFVGDSDIPQIKLH